MNPPLFTLLANAQFTIEAMNNNKIIGIVTILHADYLITTVAK
jgi:hypothetical protein